MRHIKRLIVEGSNPPTVEIDTTVFAAYIRFSRAKIAKTISEDKPGVVVAVDLDARNRVVGVELIGVKEFSIQRLIQFLHIEAPRIDWSRTRYVPSGHREPVTV